MNKVGLVFSGAGGQGVVTAAIILAEAATLHEGLTAVQTQLYGAEARGGATRSDVLISDHPINYPKVIRPNVLVCLTQAAYDKYHHIVYPGGLLISDSRYVKHTRKADSKQRAFPMHKTVLKNFDSPVTLSTCMLGVVLARTNVVKVDSVIKALEKRVPPTTIDLNKKALELGLELGKK